MFSGLTAEPTYQPRVLDHLSSTPLCPTLITGIDVLSIVYKYSALMFQNGIYTCKKYLGMDKSVSSSLAQFKTGGGIGKEFQK